jgi:hypothetical protein
MRRCVAGDAIYHIKFAKRFIYGALMAYRSDKNSKVRSGGRLDAALRLSLMNASAVFLIFICRTCHRL